MTPRGYGKKQLQELEAELQEMEAKDPKLKKLKDDIYDPVTGVLATIQRSDRHRAARKQVGGRCWVNPPCRDGQPCQHYPPDHPLHVHADCCT